MNILVVHEVSYKDKVVYEYQDFAERFALHGHSVTVIDFEENGDGSGGAERCSRTGLAEVELVHVPYRDIPVIKYLSARKNYRNLLTEKLNKGVVDVVLLYSVFVNGTITVELCREFGVPVVNRVLDIYHRIGRNLLAMLPLWLGEKYIYRNADIICVTNSMIAGYVQKMAGKGKVKELLVLTHGVDMDFFKPAPRNPDLSELYDLKDDDKVALFLGTTYAFSGLIKVVERFGILEKVCPHAKILIVGSGEIDSDLKKKVDDLGLQKRVILAGMQPYSNVPAHLSLADCFFNSFELNDITRNIIPIKTLQYVACGKPVLSTPIPDVVNHFPETESGVVYSDISDPDTFVEKLGQLLNDSEQSHALGANAISHCMKNCSMENQFGKLADILSRCVVPGVPQ